MTHLQGVSLAMRKEPGIAAGATGEMATNSTKLACWGFSELMMATLSIATDTLVRIFMVTRIFLAA